MGHYYLFSGSCVGYFKRPVKSALYTSCKNYCIYSICTVLCVKCFSFNCLPYSVLFFPLARLFIDVHAPGLSLSNWLWAMSVCSCGQALCLLKAQVPNFCCDITKIIYETGLIDFSIPKALTILVLHIGGALVINANSRQASSSRLMFFLIQNLQVCEKVYDYYSRYIMGITIVVLQRYLFHCRCRRQCRRSRSGGHWRLREIKPSPQRAATSYSPLSLSPYS